MFLQIRSHLESTAGQMPLRTYILLQICDADERSVLLQIRSHLESIAGQMPLRTCDADESIASSCRYDPIWKALQGRCHFAPVTQMRA